MQRTKVNRQEIVKYQMKVSEDNANYLTRPQTFRQDKYSTWELPRKIQQVMEKQPYNIKWVGSRGVSYLEAYIYVLFSGPLHAEDHLLELKMNLYSLGRQCLNKDQEKMLVQFMCLVGFSQHKLTLLKRYPEVEIVLLKMLEYFQKKQKRQIYSFPSDNSTEMTEMNCLSVNLGGDYKCIRQVYQALNKQFPFISLEKFTDFSYTLVAFQQEKFHIIQQKNTYFIVEPITPLTAIQKNNFSFIDNEINVLEDCTMEKQIQQKQNFDKGEFEAIFNCDNHQIVRQSKQQPLMEDLNLLFNDREASEKDKSSPVEATKERNTTKMTSKDKSFPGKSNIDKMREIQELRDNLKEIKHKVDNKIKEKNKFTPTNTMIAQEFPYLSTDFARISARINLIENEEKNSGIQTIHRNLSPQLNLPRNYSPGKHQNKKNAREGKSPTTPNFDRVRSPQNRFYSFDQQNRWLLPSATTNSIGDEGLPASTTVLEKMNGEKKGMNFARKEQKTPPLSQKSIQTLKMASGPPKRIQDEPIYRQNPRRMTQLKQQRGLE